MSIDTGGHNVERSPVMVDWRSLSLRGSVMAYETWYGHILASNEENDCEGSFDGAED
jgi:hypothetical protein